MKFLVIGSGGRESAMVRALKKSQLARQVYCAPGNPGIKTMSICVPINANEIDSLIKFAKHEEIDLTVVGPEEPLAMGIVDEFKKAGLNIFGPTRAAAQLESSKEFTRKLCEKYNIPTPGFRVFKNLNVLEVFAGEISLPFVIKLDGLAAGKGAFVCKERADVAKALAEIRTGKFGKAADKIILEEFLEGEEASCIFMVDHRGNIRSLASSQDHKAVFDGDKGPNTGGMGAYSPAPVVTLAVENKIMDRIIRPVVAAMAKEKKPFVGFLYAGLMIDGNGDPWVVEFNVRLGDPETQAIFARLKTDFVKILLKAINGQLDEVKMEWDPRPAVSVVMASKGYPGEIQKGFVIKGIRDAEKEGTIIDQAGTIMKNMALVTNGGRVLAVTALGKKFTEAKKNAYRGVYAISWGTANMHFRSDIAYRAVKRERMRRKYELKKKIASRKNV